MMKTIYEDEIVKFEVAFVESLKQNPKMPFRISSSDIATFVGYTRDEETDIDLIVYRTYYAGSPYYYVDNLDHIAYMIMQMKEYFEGDYAEGKQIKEINEDTEL